MADTRRKFTRESKVAAVRRLQTGFSVGWVARELEVNSNQLHTWRRQLEARPNTAFSGEGRRRREESPIAELERKIGQQTMEIDSLNGCLRQIEDLRRLQASPIVHCFNLILKCRPLSGIRKFRHSRSNVAPNLSQTEFAGGA